MFDFGEFTNAIKGYDLKIQEYWAMHRQNAFWVLGPHVKKGFKATDLMSLGIDKSNKKKKGKVKLARVTKIDA